MTTPAVIYAAKSTTDPRGSIPTQLADCRAAAEAGGQEVVAEYQDEAKSAFTGNRGEGLTHAKEAAIAHGAELWVQHSDRLARGDGITADHLAEVWFALRRAGVKLRSVQDDSNLEDAIRVVLIGERNFEDSKRKSNGSRAACADARPTEGSSSADRARTGSAGSASWSRARRSRIWRRSRPRPRSSGGYSPTPATASASGRSRGQPQRRRSIPTVTGAAWGQASVGRLLANPIHKGMVRNAGEVFPGIHEATVSADLWDRRRRDPLRHRARKVGGRWPKGSHLFTGGLLRCKCGAAMLPRTDPNRRGGKYEVYTCAGRGQHGLEFLRPDAHRPPPLVDEAMMDELDRHYLDVEETRRRLEAKLTADTTIATAALTDADSGSAQRARSPDRSRAAGVPGRLPRPSGLRLPACPAARGTLSRWPSEISLGEIYRACPPR